LNGLFVLYALISLMTLLWSANFVIAKVALHAFPPLLLCALRIGLAGMFLAPIYWRTARASGSRLWPAHGVSVLAFLAVCNVGNQLLFVFGLSRTSVAHSAWIIGTSPIFVLLIAAYLRLERITVLKIAGMLIAFSGVAVLAGQASRQQALPHTEATLAGDVLTCAGGLLFALYAAYGKKAAALHGTVAVNGFAYISGALLLAPIGWWQARAFPFAQVSAAGWISLVYMAIFPSAICYLIYYYALTRISASRVAAFLYVEPVIATLLAVAFLGERVTPPLAVGGTVILAGVILTERG
jgi:drug/metabolite transporter (DMT)-like permease